VVTLTVLIAFCSLQKRKKRKRRFDKDVLSFIQYASLVTSVKQIFKAKTIKPKESVKISVQVPSPLLHLRHIANISTHQLIKREWIVQDVHRLSLRGLNKTREFKRSL